MKGLVEKCQKFMTNEGMEDKDHVVVKVCITADAPNAIHMHLANDQTWVIEFKDLVE